MRIIEQYRTQGLSMSEFTHIRSLYPSIISIWNADYYQYTKEIEGKGKEK